MWHTSVESGRQIAEWHLGDAYIGFRDTGHCRGGACFDNVLYLSCPLFASCLEVDIFLEPQRCPASTKDGGKGRMTSGTAQCPLWKLHLWLLVMWEKPALPFGKLVKYWQLLNECSMSWMEEETAWRIFTIISHLHHPSLFQQTTGAR